MVNEYGRYGLVRLHSAVAVLAAGMFVLLLFAAGRLPVSLEFYHSIHLALGLAVMVVCWLVAVQGWAVFPHTLSLERLMMGALFLGFRPFFGRPRRFFGCTISSTRGLDPMKPWAKGRLEGSQGLFGVFPAGEGMALPTLLFLAKKLRFFGSFVFKRLSFSLVERARFDDDQPYGAAFIGRGRFPYPMRGAVFLGQRKGALHAESGWASASESAVLTIRSDEGPLVIKKALAAFVCAKVSFVMATESATYIHSSSILACLNCSWIRDSTSGFHALSDRLPSCTSP
ncbi:hypothetical protein GT50_08925 [Geobacillus stearothermophilus 10]|nr:hypothetical protein GT50_08925 [Geobacillus stearothermophilus 10]